MNTAQGIKKVKYKAEIIVCDTINLGLYHIFLFFPLLLQMHTYDVLMLSGGMYQDLTWIQSHWTNHLKIILKFIKWRAC